MTSSLIEQTRLVHEDLEKHMHMMVDDLLEDNKALKDRIMQETRVQARIEKMADCGKALAELYDDDDGGARAQELEDIAGEEVFARFYEKLKDVGDHYRKFPDATPQETDYEIKPKSKFSGAEVFGTFVDLHPYFERYINMPLFARLDYLSYLSKFEIYDHIPQHTKFLPVNFLKYKQYLTDLTQYLASFHTRTNPLVDVNMLLAIIHEDFDKAWKSKSVLGWTAADDGSISRKAAAEEHANNALYCVQCQKLFTKSSTFTVHLSGRKHKKAVAEEGKEKKVDPRAQVLAKLEFTLKAFKDLMKEVIQGTRDYVVKKQTRTYDEIAADLEDQQQDDELSSSDSDEEDEAVYNPLNLPLGWDGKPIPYWLYKLHGLNIEYKCDICGGFTYRGPRAYERHFSEWRHTYGLRCLGIPNGKAFLHITKFEDAIALHEKLQARDATSGWKPEDEEEYEDEDGNVFNKKTYEDLKRQGII